MMKAVKGSRDGRWKDRVQLVGVARVVFGLVGANAASLRFRLSPLEPPCGVADSNIEGAVGGVR